MTPEHSVLLNQVAGKIALELVFAEPGKDGGLLPLNCLLGELEEHCATKPVTPAIQTAVGLARDWVNGIFDTTGLFSQPVLQRLGEWVAWFQAVTEPGGGGALPATWSTPPGEVTPPAPAQPARASGDDTEPALILNLENDAELLREFANESREHLQNIEQGVLVLEENPTDADTLNATFRAFHTFKGGSGFLNLTPIKDLAHELESMLDLARQHKLAITSEVIDLILNGGDTLNQFITEIETRLNGTDPQAPIQIPTLGLLRRIRAVLENQPAPIAGPAPAAPLAAAPEPPVPSPATSKESPAPVVPANVEVPGSKGGAGASSVKVDTQKLDGLVDLVGELVIAQSLVAQDSTLRTLESQQLTRNLAQLGRITKELQRVAMSLRMVPIRSTFQKMNRLVRDTAAKTGKEVELVMEGEETELDRTIVEEISDPIVHMIRNSLDHGIEKPDRRVAQGKPARGTLWLRAFHQGGNIVIQIEDDGAGLNRERILAKAQENGLVHPNDQLSEKEIFNLIFAAGFSTAEKVTEISGRGVGMDVVRKNIDKLRGKIDISSTAGKGSCFTIYLPLTLAIIDGLIVSVAGQRFIIPTLSVCESFRPTPDMIATVHERGEMVSVRGRLRPLLRLAEFFGLRPGSTAPEQGIVVVIESGEDQRAILVDQLVGKQEIVIKNLGEAFKQNPALAGAAILGDGRVGLIVDPHTLVHLSHSALRLAA